MNFTPAATEHDALRPHHSLLSRIPREPGHNTPGGVVNTPYNLNRDSQTKLSHFDVVILAIRRESAALLPVTAHLNVFESARDLKKFVFIQLLIDFRKFVWPLPINNQTTYASQVTYLST